MHVVCLHRSRRRLQHFRISKKKMFEPWKRRAKKFLGKKSFFFRYRKVRESVQPVTESFSLKRSLAQKHVQLCCYFLHLKVYYTLPNDAGETDAA